MEVEKQGDASVVTLVGLVEPVYSAALTDEPAMLVVDLFGVENGISESAGDWDEGGDPNQTLVYDGVVNHVSISTHSGGDSGTMRVELSLAGRSDYEIERGAKGLSVRVLPGVEGTGEDELALDALGLEGSGSEDDSIDGGFEDELAGDVDSFWSAEAEPLETAERAQPEPQLAPMTPAKKLLGIETEITASGVLVHLKADGVVEQTEVFALDSPDRLVIDLPGIANEIASQSIAIDSSAIAQVRLGTHPDKVRVVMDGGEGSEGFARRSMAPVADGLYVSVGEGADLDEALAAGIAASNASLVIAADPFATGDEVASKAGDGSELAAWEEAEGDDAFDAVADDSVAGWDEDSADAEAEAGWEAAMGELLGEDQADDVAWDEPSDDAALAAETDSLFGDGATAVEEVASHGAPVEIYGVNFDATAERDRIAVLSSQPVDYEVFTPEAETVVLSFANARISGEAEGNIKRESIGPTSLISAFQQPDTAAEVRVVVTRAPGLVPQITRQGKILLIDFQNQGVAAAAPPAFQPSAIATAPRSDMAASAVDPSTFRSTGATDILGGGDPADEILGVPAGLTTTTVSATGEVVPANSDPGLGFGGPGSLDSDWAPASASASEELPRSPAIPVARASSPASPASLEPPAAVDILQEGGLIDGKEYAGRRISLDFKNVAVADVLRLIAEVSDLNIIAGQEVAGTVTIRLVDVPWDQALDVILLTKGLGFVRVGNVLRIAPADVLKVEEEVRLQERRNREKLEDLEVKLIPVNYADVEEVVGMVTRLLSARGSVDVDTRTNTLILKDITSVIDEAGALVQALDTETPQVSIEAKIVEANLDFRRELGSEWGIQTNQFEDAFEQSGVRRTLGTEDLRFINENSLAFSNPISSAATAALNLEALLLKEDFNVQVSLQAVESSGDGKVISSPRIVTLDNREAKISQGTSIPFQTFEGGDAKLEFVDAVLSLQVTPHITADRSIIMQVEVKRNAPDDTVATPTGSPAIAKNEANTETLVKDGQTMVIGGIYTIVKTQRQSRVPYFHKIPVIGNAFKNTSVTDTRKELLVFITPRVVK